MVAKGVFALQSKRRCVESGGVGEVQQLEEGMCVGPRGWLHAFMTTVRMSLTLAGHNVHPTPHIFHTYFTHISFAHIAPCMAARMTLPLRKGSELTL